MKITQPICFSVSPPVVWSLAARLLRWPLLPEPFQELVFTQVGVHLKCKSLLKAFLWYHRNTFVFSFWLSQTALEEFQSARAGIIYFLLYITVLPFTSLTELACMFNLCLTPHPLAPPHCMCACASTWCLGLSVLFANRFYLSGACVRAPCVCVYLASRQKPGSSSHHVMSPRSFPAQHITLQNYRERSWWKMRLILGENYCCGPQAPSLSLCIYCIALSFFLLCKCVTVPLGLLSALFAAFFLIVWIISCLSSF